MIDTKESYRLYTNADFIAETARDNGSSKMNFLRTKDGRQIISALLKTPALVRLLNLSIVANTSGEYIFGTGSNGVQNGIQYGYDTLFYAVSNLIKNGRYALAQKASHLKNYMKTTSLPSYYYIYN